MAAWLAVIALLFTGHWILALLIAFIALAEE